jgi:hypothetical protein
MKYLKLFEDYDEKDFSGEFGGYSDVGRKFIGKLNQDDQKIYDELKELITNMRFVNKRIFESYINSNRKSMFFHFRFYTMIPKDPLNDHHLFTYLPSPENPNFILYYKKAPGGWPDDIDDKEFSTKEELYKFIKEEILKKYE